MECLKCRKPISVEAKTVHQGWVCQKCDRGPNVESVRAEYLEKLPKTGSARPAKDRWLEFRTYGKVTP